MTSFKLITPGEIKVTITGCSHGNWDRLYSTLKGTTDLIILAGDVETPRDEIDVLSADVPAKYTESFKNFIPYFKGEKTAEIPTLFIGGNHEASSVLLELPFGGWVAPNVFFMGLSNILDINVSSQTIFSILGISGVYHEKSYPYPIVKQLTNFYDRKGVCNIKVSTIDNILSSSPLDNKLIAVSHDWPSGALLGMDQKWKQKLLKGQKADLWLKNDEGSLGCPYFKDIAKKLNPMFWFSAHHHTYIENPNFCDSCEFVAIRGIAKPGPDDQNYYNLTLSCDGSEFSFTMNPFWAQHTYGLDLPYPYPLPDTFDLDTCKQQSRAFAASLSFEEPTFYDRNFDNLSTRPQTQ